MKSKFTKSPDFSPTYGLFFKKLQCFPYIDQCVAQRHRINTEHHKLIPLHFLFLFFIFKYKYWNKNKYKKCGYCWDRLRCWTGYPQPVLRWFEFALQQGLEGNTFLSVSDPLLLEPITKLVFPPGALLAGLTQWRQGSDCCDRWSDWLKDCYYFIYIVTLYYWFSLPKKLNTSTPPRIPF